MTFAGLPFEQPVINGRRIGFSGRRDGDGTGDNLALHSSLHARVDQAGAKLNRIDAPDDGAIRPAVEKDDTAGSPHLTLPRRTPAPQRGSNPSPPPPAPRPGFSRDATISRWDGLTVSKKAVEGHVTGIFRKLRIPDAKRFDRRVAAVLTYLQASGELASQRPFA